MSSRALSPLARGRLRAAAVLVAPALVGAALGLAGPAAAGASGVAVPGGAAGASAARVHRTARRASVAAASVSGATEVGLMTTLGGAVQPTSTSYAVYWAPPGAGFSANYQPVTQGYLRDVGGTSYYGITTQYGVQNSSAFGGSWVDQSLLPGGRGSSGAPLTDSDVQSAVAAALRANPQWGPPSVTKTFFVFLPYGVYLSEGGATSFMANGFCAYHSYFMSQTGADVVYAAMPYAATDPAGCGQPGPWPNQSGDPIHPGDADQEVNLISHEQMEAVTDPLLTAWGFPSSSPIAGYEIGDACLGVTGPRRVDGSNVTLHGNPYLVQAEWSNAAAPVPNDTLANGCVVSAGAATASSPTTSTTTSSPTTSTLPPAVPVMTRLAGADRIGTAISISHDSYPQAGSAGAVVLSRSDGFADALAGTPLAAAKHAPLLLTPSNAALDPGAAAEISRVLSPGGTVYVLGGPSAVSSAVDAQLQATFNVVRLAGSDRYATAVAIADHGLGNPGVQVLATGLDFPDALSGGAAAASAGGVVLLTDGSALPPATASYLAAHPGTRWALGGPAAGAGTGVGATPLVGSDRYDTATRVARAFFPAPSAVGVASGLAFPDALGGGVHAAAHHAPLLLVPPDQVPAGVATYLSSLQPGSPHGYVYGGTTAVYDSTAAALASAL